MTIPSLQATAAPRTAQRGMHAQLLDESARKQEGWQGGRARSRGKGTATKEEAGAGDSRQLYGVPQSGQRLRVQAGCCQHLPQGCAKHGGCDTLWRCSRGGHPRVWLFPSRERAANVHCDPQSELQGSQLGVVAVTKHERVAHKGARACLCLSRACRRCKEQRRAQQGGR